MDILNKTIEPSLNEMINYTNNESQVRLNKMINYINTLDKVKQEIKYSKCMAKPGWNLKYKRKSKALCTIYPDKESFTVLVVLSDSDIKWFKGNTSNYTDYVVNLYNNSGLFNGTKWLMIEVTDNNILEDVINLMKLKEE